MTDDIGFSPSRAREEKTRNGPSPSVTELCAASFERIEGFWVAGADLPSAELEDAIDRAALAGNVDALALALGAYERAAMTNCARRAAVSAGRITA